MIKENQKYLNRIQIMLDLSLVVISMMLAYWIRFIVMQGPISISFQKILYISLCLVPLYGMIYYQKGLYKPKRKESLFKETLDIIQANLFGSLCLMVALYFFRIVDFSRIMLLIFCITNILLLVLERIAVRLFMRHIRSQGYNLRHCLIVGANLLSSDFITRVEKNKHWGYYIEGILDNWVYPQGNYQGYPVLGPISDLEHLLKETYYDSVIVALTSEDADELGYVLSQCEKAGVKSNIIPYYYHYVPTCPDFDNLDGLTVINTRRVPLDNWAKSAAKRAFDIAFALFAIAITSPIMLVAVILTKLTSPGPVIFRQERIGLNQKPFFMYKFRSMHVQSEEEEKHAWTTANDSRKTRWGSFMRKTSIDELPQFFNVLKGDMSVVGPRPERPYFVNKFCEEIPRYMIKHQVRPGITGWAQVNGYRGDTSITERIKHDLYYIENWSIFFDIEIILMTVFKGFINKNAY